LRALDEFRLVIILLPPSKELIREDGIKILFPPNHHFGFPLFRGQDDQLNWILALVLPKSVDSLDLLLLADRDWTTEGNGFVAEPLRGKTYECYSGL
jgi:hypothetical protein